MRVAGGDALHAAALFDVAMARPALAHAVVIDPQTLPSLHFCKVVVALEREEGLPPWRELYYVYRRLEARGEVRVLRMDDGENRFNRRSVDALHAAAEAGAS